MTVTAAERLPGSEAFDPAPERAYTLPSAYYVDPALHDREREAIFFRSWQWAGLGADVTAPGAYFTCRVLDQGVIVIRDRDATLRAFYNVCQHRAHELLEGKGHATVITCPYHAWSYHTDGRLRSARESDKVAGFDAEAFCLVPVQVEAFCGFVYVNLDLGAAPLVGQSDGLAAEIRSFAPDLSGLVHAHSLHYDIKANWKVVIDNFLECYHCAVAHPAFGEFVDLSSYRIVTHGIWSSHHAGTYARPNAAFDTSGAEFQHHAVWWLWPNTCIMRYPGANNMIIMRMAPDGVDRTVETLDFYFLAPEPDAMQREAIAYFDNTLQPEDVGICESVQRGLGGRGYDRGRFIVNPVRDGNSEHGVHHFHSLVLGALAN